MSREIRSLAARYPFEVRYRARELFLRGIALSEIPEILGRELDEKNAARAAEEKVPPPPPVERPSLRVLRYWSEEGRWGYYRKSTERAVLKEQVRRIRREFSERLRLQAARLRLNQSLVERYFYKPELGEDGKALFKLDGTPRLILKAPEDAPLDMADALRLHQSAIKLDVLQLQAAGDMLGGFVPKVSPEDFTLGAAPPPVGGAPRPGLPGRAPVPAVEADEDKAVVVEDPEAPPEPPKKTRTPRPTAKKALGSKPKRKRRSP